MIIKWLIFSQQKIRFKTLMLRSDLCDSRDIFVKEEQLLKEIMMIKREKKDNLQYTIQKILILLCLCIICSYIVTIIL